MSSFLDKAKALGGKAVEATADAVEIGTLKAKIAARKGDIEKQYEALGEIIYENRSTLELNPEEDPEALKAELSEIREAMAGAFSEISRLDAEIAQLEQDIETAKTTISNLLDGIKGLFNFEWSLPSLKLPHFSWYWNDIGFGISIPSISVDWYKKAMDNPMVLNNPTIFGAMGGKLLAGGEAGSEMVIGTNTLMETIREAVAGLVSGDTNINYGGVTVNVYSQPGQDISDLADEIEERINMNVAKRAAAFS